MTPAIFNNLCNQSYHNYLKGRNSCHREIKQACGIERGQSRTGRANQIFMAIAAWFEQHKRRIQHQIKMLMLQTS